MRDTGQGQRFSPLILSLFKEAPWKAMSQELMRPAPKPAWNWHRAGKGSIEMHTIRFGVMTIADAIVTEDDGTIFVAALATGSHQEMGAMCRLYRQSEVRLYHIIQWVEKDKCLAELVARA